MVVNATFNNISAIAWPSVLLLEKTGENHRPVASHRQTISHYVASSTFKLTTLVVIGTDCIGSHESNYHAIAKTMVPINSDQSDTLVNHCIVVALYLLVYHYIVTALYRLVNHCIVTTLYHLVYHCIVTTVYRLV